MVTRRQAFLGMLLWGIVVGMIAYWIAPNAPEIVFVGSLCGSGGYFLGIKERITHAK